MSGVQVGTRLDLLLELRTRVDREICALQRRLALDTTGTETASAGTRARPVTIRPRDRLTEELLAQLGVTSRAVKEWSVAAGINPAVPPGRVSLQLVQTYAKEHTS